MGENGRIVVAEAIGTGALMLGGVGTAVLAGGTMGALGVALAFGLVLLGMATTIGHVSGCHINPAVTAGLVAAGKTPMSKVPAYLGGQLAGAVVGALVLLLIASGLDGFDAANGFGANGWGDLSPDGYGFGAVAAAEIVFTALFVLVVLATTRPTFPPSLGPIAAGLTLALVHLATIPVSNTSVNPARSIGSAVVQRGDALTQVWLFLVAPTIGGLLAAGLWRALGPEVDDDEVVTKQ